MVGTSAKITYSNMVSQAYANLYNLINDRDNVPNPNDNSGTTKFVYYRIPKMGRNFKGYPFIVISRTHLDKVNEVANYTKAAFDYKFTITVYCKDYGADSNGNPNAAETMETITDNIISTLNNPTNQHTLLYQGMGRLKYDVSADEIVDFDGNYVYTAEIELVFANNYLGTQ